MSDPVFRLNAALEGRYAIDRELGEGGMATVYLADEPTSAPLRDKDKACTRHKERAALTMPHKALASRPRPCAGEAP